jgi:hypothetical protein
MLYRYRGLNLLFGFLLAGSTVVADGVKFLETGQQAAAEARRAMTPVPSPASATTSQPSASPSVRAVSGFPKNCSLSREGGHFFTDPVAQQSAPATRSRGRPRSSPLHSVDG